jgi:hypothetical protein
MTNTSLVIIFDGVSLAIGSLFDRHCTRCQGRSWLSVSCKCNGPPPAIFSLEDYIRLRTRQQPESCTAGDWSISYSLFYHNSSIYQLASAQLIGLSAIQGRLVVSQKVVVHYICKPQYHRLLVCSGGGGPRQRSTHCLHTSALAQLIKRRNMQKEPSPMMHYVAGQDQLPSAQDFATLVPRLELFVTSLEAVPFDHREAQHGLNKGQFKRIA